VSRYIREALDLLAALAMTLDQVITLARRKAFVTLDGTLLRIDRVGMRSRRDRPYYSGTYKCHGVNVQVIADPAGRLIWASPTLPGSRHDMWPMLFRSSSSLPEPKRKGFIVHLSRPPELGEKSSPGWWRRARFCRWWSRE
jgi:hypothetical protein